MTGLEAVADSGGVSLSCDLKEIYRLNYTVRTATYVLKEILSFKSNNIFDDPLIDTNYLSNDEDIKTLLASIKFAKKVIRTKPLSDIIKQEIIPGENIISDEDLINHCKKTVKTCWHPVGTCKMGTEKDELAVLTPDLIVKGIKNLRIFDASIMPNLISGNTNAPTMAVADRAVDIMMNKINIF